MNGADSKDVNCTDPRSRALNETSLSLLDVRGAVEWVHENIEAFGGDPQNIFVCGTLLEPCDELGTQLLTRILV